MENNENVEKQNPYTESENVHEIEHSTLQEERKNEVRVTQTLQSETALGKVNEAVQNQPTENSALLNVNASAQGQQDHPIVQYDLQHEGNRQGASVPNHNHDEYNSNGQPMPETNVSWFQQQTKDNPHNMFQEMQPGQGNSMYRQNVYMGNGSSPYQTQNSTNQKEKKKSSGKWKKALWLLSSATVFGLIAGGVMVGVNALGNKLLGFHNDGKKTEITSVVTADPGRQVSTTGSVADMAEEVMPAIVSINITSVQVVQSWFQSYEQEVPGSGSGIIIGQNDNEIMIATNNHVIEGAKEVSVVFCDQAVVEATVKGADSSSDLAVVTVKTKDVSDDTLSAIKVAALGSSDALRVGEPVVAIGNALGYGQSLTGGYVSALNREVEMEDKTMTLLQTDAAINPGNSGGALLNAKGEVIGINTVKFVDSTVEGMGYAIPITKAIPIINDLMNQEVIEEEEQGYLGIEGNTITDEHASSFNMPKGIYVVKIVEVSPADKSGLRAGDIIVKFADRDLGSMKDLQNIPSNKKVGQEIAMTVNK